MTVFASIAGAIKTVLDAAPAVSTVVERTRLHPLPETQLDAVVIRIDSSTPERFAILNGPINWDTTIAIECYARSATQTADVAVDALLAKVYARLAANPTLGGLVMDSFPESMNYNFDGQAEHFACVTLMLRISHRTSLQTLE